ncbi:transcriptional regulator [Actinoplanes sp. NPDC051861]|uniref:transcriptional regulator n=1 Tax=Actinoplanes sp. NPDC051861 TaxID=3155170 RepID=UPI003443931C
MNTVLHSLRCMGYAELTRIADVTGSTPSEVESDLIDLAVDGFVVRTPPPFPTWGLTEAGKAEDARQVLDEVSKAGVRDDVLSAYKKFLILNPELLDLCSAALDEDLETARVLARFEDLDKRAEPICSSLAAALPRFGAYSVRLGAALDRARSGEREYLASATDSYHGVWFQLHEDLLATLGIPR